MTSAIPKPRPGIRKPMGFVNVPIRPSCRSLIRPPSAKIPIAAWNHCKKIWTNGQIIATTTEPIRAKCAMAGRQWTLCRAGWETDLAPEKSEPNLIRQTPSKLVTVRSSLSWYKIWCFDRVGQKYEKMFTVRVMRWLGRDEQGCPFKRDKQPHNAANNSLMCCCSSICSAKRLASSAGRPRAWNSFSKRMGLDEPCGSSYKGMDCWAMHLPLISLWHSLLFWQGFDGFENFFGNNSHGVNRWLV